MNRISLKHIGWAIILLKAALLVFLLLVVVPRIDFSSIRLDYTFVLFVLFGFVAQLIDGTLGMAYGVSCSTLLLNIGIAPRVATSAVHTAEVFTTGISGLSHLKFGNFDKPLFFRIVITGVVGAVIGAYIISEVFDGGIIKPYIAGYLLIMGLVILYKGIRNKQKTEKKIRGAEWLALFGGFFDAVGGGGWGPIVTSNLIGQGKNPRETIGTVNTAEFFVTFFSVGVFIYFVGMDCWHIILGLIIGGVLAAPLGAYFAARVNKRILMILIGIVITVTSVVTIVKIL